MSFETNLPPEFALAEMVRNAISLSVPGFNPAEDWPPVGASVHLNGKTFVFEEGDAPGWWSADRQRYARPFDSVGQLLARKWDRETNP